MALALQTCDWFKVITEVMYAGVSMREMARRLNVACFGISDPEACPGCGQYEPKPWRESHLRHYRKGGEPSYPRGDALIWLWMDVTGKTREMVPMKAWTPPLRTRRHRRKARTV